MSYENPGSMADILNSQGKPKLAPKLISLGTSMVISAGLGAASGVAVDHFSPVNLDIAGLHMNGWEAGLIGGMLLAACLNGYAYSNIGKGKK